MGIANILLAIWIFLMSGNQLGWFAVSGQVLGIIGLVTAILIVLGGFGVVSYSLPTVKR